MFSWLKLGSGSLIYSFQKYFELYKVSKMPLLFAFFCFFSKKSKHAILFRNFLCEKCVDQKNGVHHDEQHGKSKKIATSVFSFSKLCHRDFCKTFSDIFNFLKKIKMTNSLLLTQISSKHFCQKTDPPYI